MDEEMRDVGAVVEVNGELFAVMLKLFVISHQIKESHAFYKRAQRNVVNSIAEQRTAVNLNLKRQNF